MSLKKENISFSIIQIKPILKINNKNCYKLLKRIIDIVCSLLGIIVLFLPLVVISIIIIVDSPGESPIFIQERIGKNGKSFRIYKLRSMIPNAEKKLEALLEKNEMDGPAFKMVDDPRITKFGRIIRKTSIDELPQLLNILKGEMSLVGPRPPLPREVEMYSEKHLQRLTVTPGLTCYWQIMPERYKVSFKEWMMLDLKYISEQSFITDVKILIKTIGTMLRMEGK